MRARSWAFRLVLALGFALAGCATNEPAGPINHAPVADAGADRGVAVGSPVTLDGRDSYDPDNDPLAYRWSFVSRPAGSAALLVPDTTAVTVFTPDLAGEYKARLMVFDSRVGDTDDVTITAVAATDERR